MDLTADELGAWRGLLRVHTALVKALDAELSAAHDLPLSSYEVLITLASAPGHKRRMAELADSVLLLALGHDAARRPARARTGCSARDTCTDDGRGCFAVLTDKGAELLAEARPTHLDGVRERFLIHFTEDELRQLATPGSACCPEPPDGLTRGVAIRAPVGDDRRGCGTSGLSRTSGRGSGRRPRRHHRST